MSQQMTTVRAGMLALLTAAAVYCAPAHADVYYFTDAQGVTHFNSQHTDPRDQLLAASSTSSTYTLPVARGAYAYEQAVDSASRENGVDPALVKAVITAESHFNPRAVSNKGAIGLMQVMPATGRRFGISNLRDPIENIKAGTRYLAFLMHQFNNNTQLAVAAYNAGEGAVIKSGYRIPHFRETANYVPKVLRYYATYRATA